MPIPSQFENRLAIPAIAAPMFLRSGPDLVVEACKHGVVGAFPSLNQRTSDGFEAWLTEIKTRLDAFETETGGLAAPYAVNLIVSGTNCRYEADLEVSVRHRVPLIISSLGAVPDLVQMVHRYGGMVFHDVTTLRHAKRAAAAGVDGLILVCAGAGGHAGTLSPFAFIPEVKEFFEGAIVLAGCISTGDQIVAAEALGADMAYLGTRFLATEEALCTTANKQMVVDSNTADIIYTSAFTGVPANYISQSVIAAGFDPENLCAKTAVNIEKEARRSIWSAGQGCGSIKEILPTAVLCKKLVREYREARAAIISRYGGKTTGCCNVEVPNSLRSSEDPKR
jgi:nitronate monooxygenase